MFGRKGAEAETQDNNQTNEAPAATARTPETNQSPAPRTASPALAQRRVIDMPHGKRHSAPGNDSAEKKLTVGKGLSLAGEITSCDVLVVEGKVEAKLTDGKMIEITESGQFRGSVEIENADIAGRYDGQLVVHGRLTIRSTGRISGTVKYGELEVSAGGQIIGEVQVAGGGSQASGNGFRSAAKFASTSDEEEDRRKSA
ncbi:MAG: polymer-forming cytoskeletal protein [Alphaproteobacteria bacterium]|nr:polymer-forming cytoskeletal protein [Alphaproteobacteria bacterium]